MTDKKVLRVKLTRLETSQLIARLAYALERNFYADTFTFSADVELERKGITLTVTNGQEGTY